ncbi:dihydrolipoyllysine-residue succinyltransferase component of 2-oxoglutarate dehydrogenase complex, mitochondrial [Onthophagus taurus]|uniref:dihydrolipoyllysine-residue succinyltransferase component of 2-oxoglutarate dehydrogenase complex, mitochondrial n=1 Tax=Onthophagus taurus TaxID=166361 RepID=UPI000C20204C|nr:dihydrolipoyllysine-residue succinyltransferase component of 2-oxoglutarate dehydrogenase complex, mitochondrial [Onthophagus taurus]
MAGMLTMASRNMSRSVIRALNESINTKTLQIGTRSIQHAVRISKNSSKLITRQHRNIYDQGVKFFRTSSILRDEVKIVACPGFPESVAEGDVKYMKKVGDPIREDDVVCEIETDKTAIPVPAPSHGVLEEIMIPDGTTVKPGDKLFKIKVGAAPAGGAAPAAKAAPVAPPSPKAAPPPTAPPPPPPPPPSAAASKPPPPPPRAAAAPPRPAAPVSSIPVAAIRHAQTLEAATVKLPPQDPTSLISGTRSEQRVKMNRMRLKIAQRLKDAQNTTAMLTTFNEIDMSYIMEYRKTNQDAFVKRHGVKLGFMSVFCKAAAYALQDQPVLNAVIDGNEVLYRDYIDISVAVATPKGLVVPVLRNVEKMSYADIEKEIANLGEKAKKGTLAIEDMDGGTFTISNGGVFGSLISTPIINMPQSAILGMHGVFDRPIAVKGQVVVRPMMYIALSYDHRLIDGREAVMFLRKIKAAVEDPRVILTGL